MAHSKQAFKRARQSEEKRLVNKQLRSRMKSALRFALTADAAQQPAATVAATKRIDKAAKAHAIHANAASRHKSRMAKALNKARAGAK
jgi:small subunit ribosomal protein S20